MERAVQRCDDGEDEIEVRHLLASFYRVNRSIGDVYPVTASEDMRQLTDSIETFEDALRSKPSPEDDDVDYVIRREVALSAVLFVFRFPYDFRVI
jgi:hypothetical protein